MRLLSFQARNIHGYLNFDLKFNDDLTFLIGINGTGKTSVLKIILGLISPSYTYLNQIDFGYAILKSRIAGTNAEIIIEAEKISAVEILLTLNNSSELFPTKGFLRKSDNRELDVELPIEEDNEKYIILRREFDSQQIVQEIKKLSTPIFLGLDRRIYEGSKIDNSRQGMLYRRKLKKYQMSDPLNMSLADFQIILYDFFRQIAFKQSSINDRFRNQIIAGSFEFIEESQFSSFKDLLDLEGKREGVIEAIKKLNMGSFVPQINVFFDKMEDVERKVREAQRISKGKAGPQDEISYMSILQKWFNNQPQLKRINDIIDISQKYQQEIDELYEPVERLKKIVNKFFNETQKDVQIDGNGDLSVRLKDGTSTAVFQLSSGEKQIITIIGHLIFLEDLFRREPGVFIIDEPELSLHLAWQQIFVKSLLEASPRTQLILATHSPSIVEKYDYSFFEDLAKLN